MRRDLPLQGACMAPHQAGALLLACAAAAGQGPDGTQLLLAAGPGMLCTRSRRWMAFSAAHNRQASGRELLLHVAALHGVAACSHPKAALSQLYQQQHTGQSSMHLLMGGSSAVDGSSNSSTQRQASGAPAAPAVRASTDALRVQQPYTPVAQRQQQSHLLHSLAPCHAGCSSKTTPSWQQQRQQQHWSHVASAPATAQAALGDGGNSVKPQPLRGDSMPVSQPLSAAAAGWGCSNAQQLSAPGQPGGTGSSKPTPSWRHKRAVDMTQEEKRQVGSSSSLWCQPLVLTALQARANVAYQCPQAAGRFSVTPAVTAAVRLCSLCATLKGQRNGLMTPALQWQQQ